MVDIVDKALRMGEGRQLKRLENVAKAVNALEDEISAPVSYTHLTLPTTPYV